MIIDAPQQSASQPGIASGERRKAFGVPDPGRCIQSVIVSVSFDTERPEELSMARRVYLVDDDQDVRVSLSFLLRTAGIEPRPFASGIDFLTSIDELQPGCILLDIRMPTLDGFGVMAELARRGSEWPVIVITGHSDIAVAVQAMKLGAIDFLEKPFEGELLVSALDLGFLMLKERSEIAGRQARHRSGSTPAASGRRSCCVN